MLPHPLFEVLPELKEKADRTPTHGGGKKTGFKQPPKHISNLRFLLILCIIILTIFSGFIYSELYLISFFTGAIILPLLILYKFRY